MMEGLYKEPRTQNGRGKDKGQTIAGKMVLIVHKKRAGGETNNK